MEVNFFDLAHSKPAGYEMAMYVADAPSIMLKYFHDAAYQTVLEYFPHYGTVQQEVFVRMTHLAVEDDIRNLR